MSLLDIYSIKRNPKEVIKRHKKIPRTDVVKNDTINLTLKRQRVVKKIEKIDFKKTFPINQEESLNKSIIKGK